MERRKASSGSQKKELRAWIGALTEPGHKAVENFKLVTETDGVRRNINPGLSDLTISFESTNTVVAPLYHLSDHRQYVCILSRIDAFEVNLDTQAWGVQLDRTLKQTSQSSYGKINRFVGSRVNIKGNIEEQPPPDEDGDDDVKDRSEEYAVGDEI